MADNIQKPSVQEVKETVEEDALNTTEIISADDSKKSTWEMVLQYRTAILWSAFMGLAAINWGMDVLVRFLRVIVKHFVLTTTTAL
jgi:hypothetical protein